MAASPRGLRQQPRGVSGTRCGCRGADGDLLRQLAVHPPTQRPPRLRGMLRRFTRRWCGERRQRGDDSAAASACLNIARGRLPWSSALGHRRQSAQPSPMNHSLVLHGTTRDRGAVRTARTAARVATRARSRWGTINAPPRPAGDGLDGMTLLGRHSNLPTPKGFAAEDMGSGADRSSDFRRRRRLSRLRLSHRRHGFGNSASQAARVGPKTCWRLANDLGCAIRSLQRRRFWRK